MKKVLYSFAALATLLLFLNNVTGPASKQGKGYTGAPGDEPNTCATCHNAGTFGTTATLQILDAAGTTAVTKYALNTQYTIRMTISTTAGTPTGYGFQMIDIRKSDNSNVKGFLPTTDQAMNVKISTIAASGRVYAEHGAALTNRVIDVKWKAPATDIGTVVFYGAGNAVNGGGTFAGDNGSPSVSVQLPSPITSGVNELAENVKISVSPNPTPSVVSVLLDSKVSKTMKIQITDMAGRAVLTQNWAVTVGQNQQSLDLHTFAKGAYMVQIIDNQDVISKKILKL